MLELFALPLGPTGHQYRFVLKGWFVRGIWAPAAATKDIHE